MSRGGPYAHDLLMSNQSYLTLLALEDQLRHDRRTRDHWIAGHRGHRPATDPGPRPWVHHLPRLHRAAAALAGLALSVAAAA